MLSPARKDSELEEIVMKTEELAQIVCRSEAYHAYDDCLSRLRKQDSLYRKLNEFREKNMILNLTEYEKDISQDQDRLYSEYENLLTEPLVMSFLAAEQKVCGMIRTIYEELASHIDVDLSHLSDGKDDDK